MIPSKSFANQPLCNWLQVLVVSVAAVCVHMNRIIQRVIFWMMPKQDMTGHMLSLGDSAHFAIIDRCYIYNQTMMVLDKIGKLD